MKQTAFFWDSNFAPWIIYQGPRSRNKKNWKAESLPYHSSPCKQPQQNHHHLLHAGTSKNNGISWHGKMDFNILKKLVPGEFLCLFPQRANPIFADKNESLLWALLEERSWKWEGKGWVCRWFSDGRQRKVSWKMTAQKLCSTWPQLQAYYL